MGENFTFNSAGKMKNTNIQKPVIEEGSRKIDVGRKKIHSLMTNDY
jgi:hypothetical protein